MARKSARVERDLRAFGDHVAGWRKMQGLTTAVVAERAGITRNTLAAIEHGDSTTTANLFAVLRALGAADTAVDALDPLATELGRANADRLLAERIRG
jgi:transcriptional regulator with XRE-family HTH domain